MPPAQSPANQLAVIQYWHSGKPPADVAPLIATFRDRNPRMPHLLFDEETAEDFIAERFSQRELEAFRSCAVPAMQADYFRYCGVLALGGIYADADLRCVGSLQTLLDRPGNGFLFARNRWIINGFFAFKWPGHPLLELVLETATLNIEQRLAEKVHLVTGPWILSGLAALNRAGSVPSLRRRVADKRGAWLLETFTARGGNYERVAEAFKDVLITPLDTASQWIVQPRKPSYKRSQDDWVRWHRSKATIFR